MGKEEAEKIRKEAEALAIRQKEEQQKAEEERLRQLKQQSVDDADDQDSNSESASDEKESGDEEDEESEESANEPVDDGNNDFFNQLNQVYAESDNAQNDQEQSDDANADNEEDDDVNDWFYVDLDGESKGPVTIDDIRQLSVNIFVWNKVSLNEWTEIKNIRHILYKDDTGNEPGQSLTNDVNASDNEHERGLTGLAALAGFAPDDDDESEVIDESLEDDESMFDEHVSNNNSIVISPQSLNNVIEPGANPDEKEEEYEDESDDADESYTVNTEVTQDEDEKEFYDTRRQTLFNEFRQNVMSIVNDDGLAKNESFKKDIDIINATFAANLNAFGYAEEPLQEANEDEPGSYAQMPSRARNNANINYKSEEFKEGINEMPSPKPAKKHPPRPTSPLPVPPSRKAPQPPASSKPVSPPQNRLICPQCTFSNDINRKTCSVCGASLT